MASNITVEAVANPANLLVLKISGPLWYRWPRVQVLSRSEGRGRGCKEITKSLQQTKLVGANTSGPKWGRRPRAQVLSLSEGSGRDGGESGKSGVEPTTTVLYGTNGLTEGSGRGVNESTISFQQTRYVGANGSCCIWPRARLLCLGEGSGWGSSKFPQRPHLLEPTTPILYGTNGLLPGYFFYVKEAVKAATNLPKASNRPTLLEPTALVVIV